MKKYLIIDDDTDDRDMFCEALGEVSSDIKCYSAPNGRSAMKALEEGKIYVPELIFLDINMPVMNGWQFLSMLKAKEEYKNIPVIIYSTSSYPEDIEKAQQLGALCFFTKPSNYRQLKEILAIVDEHMKSRSLVSLVQSSPLFSTGSVE